MFARMRPIYHTRLALVFEYSVEVYCARFMSNEILATIVTIVTINVHTTQIPPFNHHETWRTTSQDTYYNEVGTL